MMKPTNNLIGRALGRTAFFTASLILFGGMATSAQAALTPAEQQIEAELNTLTAGQASLDFPNTGTRVPTDTELTTALALAIADNIPATITADQLAAAAANYRKAKAPLIAGAAVKELLNGTGNDGVVTGKNYKKTLAKVGLTVQAVFNNAGLNTLNNKANAASAIMASVMCGINEDAAALGGTGSKNFKKAVSTAVLNAVKSVKTISGAPQVNVPLAGDPLYPKTGGKLDNAVETGNVAGDGKAPVKAPAGIATAAVAQVQGVGQHASNNLVKAVVTAAVKGAKNLYLEIAQAAATAAAIVDGNAAAFDAAGGDDVIVKGAAAAFPTSVRAKKTVLIKEAVKFGIAEATIALTEGLNVTTHLGVGAGGIANYAYNNCTGPKVTDISGL